MQKTITKILLVFVMIMSISVFAQAQALSSTPRKGVIRVKLQPEVAAQIGHTSKLRAKNGTLSTGVSVLDASAQKIKAISVKRVFPYAAKFEEQKKKYGLDRWYEISFDESISPEKARSIFQSTAGVQLAEMEIPMQLLEGGNKYKKLTAAELAMIAPKAAGMYPFNDPQLGAQWHYHNDGSLAGSVAGADANIFEAWKTETGKSNVIVAIIDGGIDYTHNDLSQNIWVNEAELNGTPGVDDDGNGYVDDIYGYNFVSNTAEVYPHTHGTHVAGTVGAVNNNGIGVCGVAGGNGNGGVRMLSSQIFDGRSEKEGSFAEAIVYAAEQGASIAQCSWGWTNDGYYEQAVLDAIDYFTEFGGGSVMKGGLCIFASGNTGENVKLYPGAYDKTVAVASMCCDLTPASYSTHGDWVDITAPGGLVEYNTKQGVLSTLPDNSYGFLEGTSMATPHVSGIAALILSKYGKKDFPVSTLRQQLLTSVNDFYTTNPDAEGLYGSGYIDGGKALQMGTGVAPSPVAEYTLTPSQEDILIEWIIPASSDNNVNNHILYYSTAPFTGDNLDKVPNKVIDTKFSNSGDPISYDLEGLKPTTTYYIALKAVDRWGNSSALSDVKTATTNAGPRMEIDTDELNIDVDQAGTGIGSASFNISNADEGLLKWKYYTHSTPVSMWSVVKPNPGKITSKSKKLGAQRIKKLETVYTDEYSADDYPKVKKDYDSLVDNIGYDEPDATNSMAQWFKIDAETYPDGFNLTHLNIEGDASENPVIKIYRGDGKIAEENLLENVTYDWFTFNYDIALPEQLYFAPGESFWVVMHTEAGLEYPLGLGYKEGASFKGTSYMSSNGGATWVQLTEELKGSVYEELGDQVCWAVSAISKNPDWSQLLVLNPSEGSVKKGESQEVTVSNDGQRLVNGTYKFNINFTTNESEANTNKVDVTMNVTGNKPQLTCAKVIAFGDLLVGQSKSMNIEVGNIGYGDFYGSDYGEALTDDNIVSNSEHFVPTTYMDGGFPARSKRTIEVKYAPQSAGSHTGTITLTDKDGNKFDIIVHGVAGDPSKIAFEPETIEAGDLTTGTEMTKSFVIKNEGSYPLEYVLPKFSNDSIDGISSKVHKFGYEYISNINESEEFAYDNNPELINATDITSQFDDVNKWSEPISIGFSFPYYGKKYDKIYISSYGGIAFETQQLHSPLYVTENSLGNTGFISMYGYDNSIGPDTKIEWAKQDGKIVVKFINVLASVYQNTYTPVSYHMTIDCNGNIEMFYDDYNHFDVFQEGRNICIGINDPGVTDPLTVTEANMANQEWTLEEERTPEGDIYSMIGTGTAIKFIAPDANFITNVTPSNGVVNPGQEATITATLSADDTMYAGAKSNKITVLSNDPLNETSFVKIKANIVGDNLVPKCELENDNIDFGSVFRTAVKSLPVTVKNVGTKEMEITSTSLANNKFTYEFTTPCTIKPGDAKDIILTLPTEVEGAVSDVLSVVTDAGTVTANLSATVIGVPTADFDKDGYTKTIACGEKSAETLNITNNGNEPLVYSIIPNDLISLNTSDVKEGESIDYIYDSSVDNQDIKFNWVDIVTNGKGTQSNFTYYYNHDYSEVELPFEFPFYGKKYSKMYIYNTGFISFTKRNDEKESPEPPTNNFPDGTLYKNMIAPYWGKHSMGQGNTDGTYYYMTDNQIVVTFMGYGNSMNLGVCFQAILNKDGSFKYQYKGADEDSFIFGIHGLAGTINDDVTKSTRVPERFISFDNAIEFYPVKSVTVNAAESETVNFDIVANKLAGEYNKDIVIKTNVPNKETVNIPINLTITGTPDPVFPKSLGGCYVTGSINPDGVLEGGNLEFPFSIVNNGTAAFTITDITSTLPETEYSTATTLFSYGKHIDMWTGKENISWGMYDAGTEIEVGRDAAKFTLLLNDFFTIGKTEGVLTFHVSGLEGISEINVPVSIEITDSPVIGFDAPEVHVTNAAEDYKGTSEFKITNTGAYKLVYNLYLDPTGEGEKEEEFNDNPGIMMSKAYVNNTKVACDSLNTASFGSKIKPMDNERASLLDLPADFTYTNALYYPAFGQTGYVFGSNNVIDRFMGATYYKVPSEGFNIGYVYTIVNIGELTNAQVDVEIVKGNDPAGSIVLGKGSLIIPSQADPKLGQYVVIKLDKEVYLQPNQEFYVRITYPKGVDHPAYLISKEEDVVSNRYMAYSETVGWYDAATNFKDSYGSLGYISTCLETSKGSSWIKMLTPETSGEIAVDGETTIKVEMNAKYAPLTLGNKAVVVIKSNDTSRPIANYPIILDKNSAPAIELPESTVLVNEGASAVAEFNVVDADGDDLTISLGDNTDKFVTIESCTALDDTENAVIDINKDENKVTVSGCTNGVKVGLKIAPDYGTAGKHNVLVQVSDAEHVSNAVLEYEIAHVNRAPIASEISSINVVLNTISSEVKFADIFTDPDGDDMTYDCTLSNSKVAGVIKTETGFYIAGIKKGYTVLTVTATDSEGASASTTANVNVKTDSGVEVVTIESGVSVYPNPVATIARVTCDFDVENGDYRLYNSDGALVYNETATRAQGEAQIIDMSSLSAGIYLLQINVNGATKTVSIIKK